MSSLPIFDEALGEFVMPPPKKTPQASARPSLVPAAAPPDAPSAPAKPRRKREVKVAFFQTHLQRLKQSLSSAGKAEDAEIIGQLIDFLNNREPPREIRRDGDHQPIYAVVAAYIKALTLISIDETTAAQWLARKLVALGFELPKHGGDTRGWKRLLLWRDHLERGRFPPRMAYLHERAFRFAKQAPLKLDLKAALERALKADDRAA